MKKSALFLIGVVAINLLSSTGFAVDQLNAGSSIRLLKGMSKIEREQFDRNLTAFQQISPDQKSAYRKLHEDLTQEQKETGGSLTSLMGIYSVWLMTLTPNQRDELQQETDVAKKIAIVRRFKEEQDRSFEHHDMPPEESMAPASPKNIAKLALDKKDLDAVFRVLIDALPVDRRKAEYDDLGLNTYLPILHDSILMIGNSHEWPGEFLMPKMLAAMRKEAAKEITRASSKRDAMVRMTLMGVLKLANDQVHDPTTEERIQTALTLTAEEREKISKLSYQQVKNAIRKKYLESKGEEGRRQMAQLMLYRRQVVELFDTLGVELPPILKRSDRTPRGKGS